MDNTQFNDDPLGSPESRIHGDFPPVMFRVFGQEEYAHQFVKGTMRFGNLVTYADAELGVRTDHTEGKGRVRFHTDEMISLKMDKNTGEIRDKQIGPGVMNLRSSHINPTFISCFSAPPNADMLSAKFGTWAVRITDPRQLGQSIADHLYSAGQLDFPLESVKVRYDHGGLLPSKPPPIERHQLSYAHKPPAFAHEYEYRFVLQTSVTHPPVPKEQKFWEFDLGQPLDHIELIELKMSGS